MKPRRQFIQFLGASAVVAAGHRVVPGWLVAQSAAPVPVGTPLFDGIDFRPAPVSHADALSLAEGFQYEILLRRGQRLNGRGETYGDDNDYLGWVQRSDSEGWLWCNHEASDPLWLLGEPLTTGNLSRKFAHEYLDQMGGSCVRMRRRPGGDWRPVVPDEKNFRISGHSTGVMFTGPAAGSSWLHGARSTTGSFGNCGGGVTPWGTFCSGEEQTSVLLGDPELGDRASALARFLDHAPEHFGYIVEIDPDTREVFKHTALGRFAHENIAFTLARDGRLVGYMGDDRPQQCLYKFISHQKFDSGRGKENRRLLSDGTLYVANTQSGRWQPLDPSAQPSLKKAGFDLARVSVHTRTAAWWVGGTPHARPEDIEVHPVTGDVFVSLSAQAPDPSKPPIASDAAGAIARLKEAGADAAAVEFQFSIFVRSSPDTGLVWPDNLGLTTGNNLLVCSDYDWQHPLKPASTQAHLGNNHLLLVPTTGVRAGQPIRFATAPNGAEFCSPNLSPDRSELWLNVQHPGQGSTSLAGLHSHWPDGGDAPPRSSLVAIRRHAQ